MIELFNAIVDMTDINAQEKSFLLVLLRHLNHKTGLCFPSLETLQKKSGIKSKSTLLKTRQSLVDRGLISYQKSGTKLYYSINIRPVQNFNQTGIDFNESQSNFRLQTEVNKEKEQNILLNINESNPYYEYLNGGYLYEELSSELIH